MRRGSRAWAGLAACTLAGLGAIALRPGRAGAEEAAPEQVVLELRGESPGTDDAARTRAIDLAFAGAAERGLTALVGEKDREQNRTAIDKAIVRRAREFVASYQVVSERADGGRTVVVISATLDLGKLRAALAELKVPVSAAVGRAGPFPGAAKESEPGAGGGNRPGALLLLKVSTPDGTVANFGRGGGDGGPAGAALEREIQSLGLRLRSPGSEPMAVSSIEGDTLLPVGDEAAVELARRVGASSVWVVGMEVRADGPIRATRLQGAAGRGKLRVLDADRGELIAEAELEGAGFDRALSPAAGETARDLAQRLAGAVAGRIDERWSSTVSTGGPQILVRVRGARTWASIGALIHRLGSTSGVDAVHAREVVRGRVALAVETRLAAARVASALQLARLPTGALIAQARGEREVDVEIQGDSTIMEQAEDSGDAGPE